MAGVPVTVIAGRLTQVEEHQERGRFLNVESMAGVPVTVMAGRLTQ
jgi:glutamate-1-semialdehyde aminotransferase